MKCFISDENIVDPSKIVGRPSMDGGAVSCQATNPLTRHKSPIAQVPLNVRFLQERAKEQEPVVSFR